MTLLKYALEYLKKGYSIIPINPTSKKPLLETWRDASKGKDFTARVPSEKEVRVWFRRWPNANIGIVTGKISNLVVIDIDDIKKLPEVKKLAPTNHISVTGNGGRHLFYTYPVNVQNVPNSVGILPGVDVRGDGGYVIAPPSRHANGNLYRYETEKNPGILPSKALKLLLKEDTKEKKQGDTPKWIADLMKGTSEGGRNAAAAKLAGYYAKTHAKDIVFEIIQSWNTRNNPPIDDKELNTIVNSVFKTIQRKGKQAPVNKTVEEEKEEYEKVLETLSLDDFLYNFGGMETDWMIEGWVPAECIQFIVAAPESYKTWLLLDLAVSVATGLPFLGLYRVNPSCVGPVLLFQQEDFLGNLAARIQAIVCSKLKLVTPSYENGKFIATIPPDIPIYVHPNGKLRFDNPNVMDELEEKIKTLKPKMVLADPFYSTADLSNYGADAVKHMMRIKDFRRQYKCSFVIVHHTTKPIKSSKKKDDEDEISIDRQDLWGSQLLNGFMEAGIQIRQTREAGTIAIKRHFKIAESDKTVLYLKFEINTVDPPYFYKVSETTLATPEEGEVNLADYVRDNGPKTHTQMADETGLNKSKITRQLKALVEDGVLKKNNEGFYVIAKLRTKF